MSATESAATTRHTQGITCVCSTEALLYVADAAATLKVSRSYLYGGLREGRFPGKRFGRCWRISTDFVRGFLVAPNGTDLESFAAKWMAREAEAVAS